jgi:hypothetical protein
LDKRPSDRSSISYSIVCHPLISIFKKEGSKMKAIVYTKYGSPDVLQLETGRARGKVVISVEKKNIK